nr:cell division protein FtsK [Acidimicrobiia bacterium]
DVPTRVASLVGAKLAFRLADRYDYTALGIPAVDPPRLPGRAFESGSGRELQVAIPEERNLEAAVPTGGSDKPSCAPWAIDVLPQDVAVADVVSAARIDADCWFLPIGLGDTTLAPAGLVLRPGDHALIAGPARSGKSTALLAAAAAAKAVRPDLSVVAVVPRNSPLTAAAVVDRVVAPEDFAALDRENGEWLLLVDDAELVEGSKHLSNLVRSRDCGIRVVAAGAADAIRTLYGHWTQDVRRSRVGCALRPNIAIDGDLWQTPLPRRRYGKFPVGRGYLLADGRAELAQLGRL